MSYLVIWLPQAIQGVQKAYEFLAEKDAELAKVMAETLLQHVQILEKFPHAGRPASDLDPEHRELLISFGASGYVLIYEVIENSINILALKHQKEIGY